MNPKRQVGLVVGGGAGPEIAAVFRYSVERLAIAFDVALEIVEHAGRPPSFTEMRDWPVEAIEGSVQDAISGIEAFYKELASSGIRSLFRTAVNAEALYSLRTRLLSVKFVPLTIGGRRVLMARDLAQGFYACEDWSVSDDEISFQGSFSSQTLLDVQAAAIAEGGAWLRGDYSPMLIYKHHLFANSLYQWSLRAPEPIDIHQPGAGFVALMELLEQNDRDILVVAGNEIGDLLHEALLSKASLQSRETAFCYSCFLSDEVRGLREYQTVHGSADDIAGQDRVNPVATLRSVAAIFDREFGLSDLADAVEASVQHSVDEGWLSEKLEMTLRTKDFADKFLTHLLQDVGSA